jgi:hypothetical protein
LIIVAMILLLRCGGEYTGTAGMVDLGVFGLVLIFYSCSGSSAACISTAPDLKNRRRLCHVDPLYLSIASRAQTHNVYISMR